MTINMTRMGLFLINLIIVLILFISGNYQAIGAEDSAINQSMMQLSITPERCVALRQGQTCYQQVQFNWRNSNKGDFCLIDTNQNTTLQCWTQKTNGQLNYDFQAQQSRSYVMRAKDSSIDLALQKITVAWVYKSSKRPKASWRLF
ncbi:DUF3019 domain-containing protein [Paraglaciecola sp.]|uniref:DUF3019 domain-containing protein n=1 Tax=Paraglaciecola sp. TaxID=1920173 RepID=UPI003EF771CB